MNIFNMYKISYKLNSDLNIENKSKENSNKEVKKEPDNNQNDKNQLK